MRKCLGILLFALVPSFVLAIDLSVGLKIGTPLTFLYGQEYEAKKIEEKAYWDSYFFSSLPVSEKPNLGIHGDIFCTIGVFDFFSIQPEIAFTYIRPGFKLDWSGTGYSPITIEIAYDYVLIELPLLIKSRFNLNKRKTLQLTAFAGPELMIALTSPTKIYGANATGEEPSNPLYYKHGAWSLIFGMGLDYSLRSRDPWYFTLDTRYNFNLTSFDNSPVPALNDTKMHMFTLSLGIGWKVINQGV